VSKVLEQLRELVERCGPEAALSIRMSLYNYGRTYTTDPAAQSFTFGNVVGAIGVALPSEPKSFVLGRRFAPTSDTTPVLSWFDAMVDLTSSSVSVDLGGPIPARMCHSMRAPCSR